MESGQPGRTDLQPYWDRVSGEYAAADPLGAVCYPGAPRWLNRFVAGLQWKAVTRALDRLEARGARALDIGCGFGRWTRWLHEHGADAVGVDPTEGMLQAARRASPPAIGYRRMSATELDFPDERFDLVTCITVVQHLTPDEQERAIAEIGRVLRPGGRAVLLELIDLADEGKIVYPRAPVDWVEAFGRAGLRVERWEGQEFVPLIRAFRWAAERVGRALGMDTGAQREGPSLLEQTSGRPAFRIAYAGLWLLVQASRPLEPMCRVAVPRSRARHALFVVRKGA